jgi:hypothetical protein
MVGTTLLGPTLDEHMLLEAIGRVCKLVDRMMTTPKGVTREEDEFANLFEGL